MINYLKITGSLTKMEELQRDETEGERQDPFEQCDLEDLAHSIHQESHSQAYTVQHPLGGDLTNNIFIYPYLNNYYKFTGSLTKMEELQRDETESKRQDKTEQCHMEDLAHSIYQESHSQANTVQHSFGGDFN